MSLHCLLPLMLFRPCAIVQNLALNFADVGQEYQGIGALSGGGGVTRLLVDYDAAIQSDIFDILFKPNAGASLQTIKVEIGGETMSTAGTEQTHERYRGDLNCSRGYEWTVLAEAKKRNPSILTYGLSWGAPAWVGNGSYYSDDGLKYHVDWVACAKSQAIDIDFLGIWNEKGYDVQWIKGLRKSLDAAGYQNTRIVASDQAGLWDIVADMEKDPDLFSAIDVVGSHYPFFAPPVSGSPGFNKAFWSSEMFSLKSTGDWDGAGALSNDFQRYAEWGISSSIVWCLIYSWFIPLAFGNSGSPTNNGGTGHALLTAAEPWSGFYSVNGPIAVTAHWTQFVQPGWMYLQNGSGIGSLPGGGSYSTLFSQYAPQNTLMFSIIITTMTNVSADQTVTFAIVDLGTYTYWPSVLHVWQTTESAFFMQQPDVAVGLDGSFNVTVPAGAMVSVSSTSGQGWVGAPRVTIPPSQPFPFPYEDSFEAYPEGAYARYFSDLGGVWLASPLPHAMKRTGNALKQVTPATPIPWNVANPNPCTCAGNGNSEQANGVATWKDYQIMATGAIDADTPLNPTSPPFLWLTIRFTDYRNIVNNWLNGYNFYLYAGATEASPGTWALLYGQTNLTSGLAPWPVMPGAWYTFKLSAVGNVITATVNGALLVQYTDENIIGLSGMIALGSGWHTAWWDDFFVGPV